MLRLGLALVTSALLAGPAFAWADFPVPGSPQPAAAEFQISAGASAEPPPAVAEKRSREQRRLSTAERWRGKPYLAAEDSIMRAQALDKALPPSAPTFATGGIGLQAVENEALRKQALDMALPGPVNRILVGGF